MGADVLVEFNGAAWKRGRGLASRAKYQFPDVYVKYQDACRSKALKMGKHYLYKREAFIDEELADDSGSLTAPNARKWFLLATKTHWRDNADLAGIEAGICWVRDNYQREGIRSLAVPALGCGLGQLDWKDVGPIMCRGLEPLGIDVAVYLPRERPLPPPSSSESKGPRPRSGKPGSCTGDLD